MPKKVKTRALKAKYNREEEEIVIPLRGAWTPKNIRAFKKAIQQASEAWFAPPPSPKTPPGKPAPIEVPAQDAVAQ